MEKFEPDCKTLMEHFRGGVLQCACDPRCTIVGVNRGFLELTGFSRADLDEKFGDSYESMICGDDLESFRNPDLRGRADGTYESMYRILSADGSYKWVIESAQTLQHSGKDYLYRIVQDITVVQSTKEELSLSLERYKIIMDQTAEIIWEWNLPDDTLVVSPNWLKKFGYPIFTDHVLENFAKCDHVHPDDSERIKEYFRRIQAGAPFSEADFRISNASGKFSWFRLRATVIFDQNDHPARAVGVVTDIDQEKRKLEEYRKRASTDTLTGLLNRGEFQNKISGTLAGQKNGALLILDTDNFKTINDTKGHLYGDAVLSEISTGLKKRIGKKGYAGRIGGDEFAVFLKDADERKTVEFAQELLKLFRGLFTEEKSSLKITCSIGGACFPADGRDFVSLYSKADRALYEAKNQGKNRFRLYSKELGEMNYSTLGAEIDSDTKITGESGNFANYIFDILYSAEDLFQAIDLILEIIGKRFDVSRVYIFENTEDATVTSNTFEWCNEEIEPQKHMLQNILFSEVGNYQELFNDGVFFCRDVRTLEDTQADFLAKQNIRATLQCKISDGDHFWGFIGFDECTGLRFWTQSEINVLLLTAKLLSTFLTKRRAQDKDRAYGERLNQILNTLDAYVYVVRKDTLRLLYLNSKTRELDALAKPGMTCHKAFFGKDSPCDSCPIQNQGKSIEVFNPQYGVWTKAHAATLDWDGDAYLVSCYDITDYKK